MAVTPPVVLAVAGVDPSGGAGLVADVRTIAALGCWPAVAVTAVTAQNTSEVRAVHGLSPAWICEQIEAVADDYEIAAVKVGMVAGAAIAGAVADLLSDLQAAGRIGPVVVDPVMRATTGASLGPADGLAELLAAAAVVTPNLAEAARLSGIAVEDRAGMEAAGRRLLSLGAKAALVTGGHLGGAPADCLVSAQGVTWIEGRRVVSTSTHGTGCVLSAAVAALLGRGEELEAACRQAKDFVTAAIVGGVGIGRGAGPVDPGAVRQDQRAGPASAGEPRVSG